ncbi:hypothetical protein BJ997_001015 [Cryobacterium roopkundense]|uniref:Uncharacterized protein n=1 Tax=Cryobacterium roopkundense TaxID=1001240 RepID=A0A7W8ZUL3_9MICO|nr:hypothetical protein [Cryobacterium roopkundense]
MLLCMSVRTTGAVTVSYHLKVFRLVGNQVV